MSAHTPGPWLVDGETIYALQHAGWDRGVEVMENRFFGHLAGKADREELRANARLIAAAPDLLEVVEQGLTFFLIHSDDCDMVDEVEGACPCGALQMYLKATTVLAKTRGR